MKEERRTIGPGVDLVLTGEDVQPMDAVLAEVIIELAAEAGGKLEIRMDDAAMMAEVTQRMRQKGVDMETGEWLH